MIRGEQGRERARRVREEKCGRAREKNFTRGECNPPAIPPAYSVLGMQTGRVRPSLFVVRLRIRDFSRSRIAILSDTRVHLMSVSVPAVLQISLVRF